MDDGKTSEINISKQVETPTSHSELGKWSCAQVNWSQRIRFKSLIDGKTLQIYAVGETYS